MLRFFKFGMGLGVYYVDLSYKLNLCSQYKVTPKVEDGKAALNGHGGECVGKTEIDSASNKWGGVAFVSHVAIWEGVSKEGIPKSCNCTFRLYFPCFFTGIILNKI